MAEAAYSAWRASFRDSAGNRVSAERVEFFQPGRHFQVGDIEVLPFTIPHDAVDPVGFTFTAEGTKVGYVTDLGYLPASVRQHLRGCDGLMIESNHDLEMLRVGPYPWMVKQRVMSRVGHLSNDALAEFLATDYDGGAAFLILAHLSEQNNHPDIARMAAERALEQRRNLWRNRILLATQDEGLPSVSL
jgi:phosphoribosyl 1,2-cyclic phosphodiesterase